MGDSFSSIESYFFDEKKIDRDKPELADFVTLENGLEMYIIGIDYSKKVFFGIDYRKFYELNRINILEKSDRINFNKIIKINRLIDINCNESYKLHCHNVKNILSQ